jgi:uncharacterized membrane protein YbhN (UPF0104 family)
LTVDSIREFWDATVAFADGLASVGWQALGIAIACHVTNLVLRSRAWRNILAYAHPGARVRWRSILGAYVAGVGLNSVVPARGGDVMKLYLAHRSIPGSSYATIASSLLAETAFDTLIGPMVFLYAYSTGNIPSLPDLPGLGAFEWSFFASHIRWFLLLLAAVLIGVGIWFNWLEHHVSSFWARIRAGLSILANPRRYLRQVVAYQAVGWCFRVAAMYWFLKAWHIDASIGTALLVLAAGSAATLMPFTPGGAGTTQALLAYMLRGLAPASIVLAFSVGMQVAMTLANVILGGLAIAIMLRRLPWKARIDKDAALAQDAAAAAVTDPGAIGSRRAGL